MFKRLSTHPQITFYFEDKLITANEGDTVAAALLANNTNAFRQSTVTASARGPFCMMGACYECLVVHHEKTVQACMLPAQQDMHIKKVQPPASITGLAKSTTEPTVKQ